MIVVANLVLLHALSHIFARSCLPSENQLFSKTCFIYFYFQHTPTYNCIILYHHFRHLYYRLNMLIAHVNSARWKS